MKNKKGFTLVEIIVTIALLALIGIIIAVNVVNISKKQESKEKTRIESIIKTATEAYVDVEKKETSCVKVDDLINSGYLKKTDVEKYNEKYVKIIEDVNTKSYEIVDEEADCDTTVTTKEYKLAYDGNATGVTNVPSSVKGKSGTSLVISSKIPQRLGYKFKGWAENKNGKVKYKAGDNYKITENKTLYAVWSINSYIVEYDTQGKADIDSQELDYNSTITLPKVTANDACFGLNGWKEEASGTIYAGEAKYTILGDTKFIAQWGVATYSLNYFANTEDEVTNIPSSQTVECGSGNTLLSNLVPQRTGYTFKGWSTSKKGSINYKPGDNINVSTTINLYAVWEVNSYIVNFNTDGKEIAPESITKNYKEEITLPDIEETSACHLFSAWQNSETSKNYAPGVKYTIPASDTTFNAIWIKKTYALTYKANGNNVINVPSSLSLCGSTRVSGGPTRIGYTFKGWSTSANGKVKYKVGDYIKVETSTTLYAVWEANVCTITLNKNEGSGGSNKIYLKYDSGLYKDEDLTEKITNIEVPSKEPYYNFNGYWSESNRYITTEGKIENIFTNTLCTTEKTMDAMWKEKAFKISLDLQGGTSDTTKLYSIYNKGIYKNIISLTNTVNGAGSIVESISIPTRVGYTFKGYYSLENQKGVQYIDEDGYLNFTTASITNDITLYAAWEANTYTITLNQNGGTGGTDKLYETYGSQIYYMNGTTKKTLNPNDSKTVINIPTRTGYTFEGYYDVNGSQWIDKTGKIKFGVYKFLEDTTLTAKWSISNFTVTYKTDSKAPTPEALTVSYNTTILLPTVTPVKCNGVACYELEGWRDTNTNTVYKAGKTFTMPARDVTFAAVWKPLVTITAINATPTSTSMYVYSGSNHSTTFTPYTGYTFDNVICDGKDFSAYFNESTNNLTLENVTSPISCNVEYKKVFSVSIYYDEADKETYEEYKNQLIEEYNNQGINVNINLVPYENYDFKELNLIQNYWNGGGAGGAWNYYLGLIGDYAVWMDNEEIDGNYKINNIKFHRINYKTGEELEGNYSMGDYFLEIATGASINNWLYFNNEKTKLYIAQANCGDTVASGKSCRDYSYDKIASNYVIKKNNIDNDSISEYDCDEYFCTDEDEIPDTGKGNPKPDEDYLSGWEEITEDNVKEVDIYDPTYGEEYCSQEQLTYLKTYAKEAIGAKVVDEENGIYIKNIVYSDNLRTAYKFDNLKYVYDKDEDRCGVVITELIYEYDDDNSYNSAKSIGKYVSSLWYDEEATSNRKIVKYNEADVQILIDKSDSRLYISEEDVEMLKKSSLYGIYPKVKKTSSEERYWAHNKDDFLSYFTSEEINLISHNLPYRDYTSLPSYTIYKNIIDDELEEAGYTLSE